jgi:hypothetical protein
LSLRALRTGSGTATGCSFCDLLGQSEGLFSIRDFAIEKSRSNPGQRPSDVWAREPKLGQLRATHRCPTASILGPPSQDTATNGRVCKRVEGLHGLLWKITEGCIDGPTPSGSSQRPKRSIRVASELNDSEGLLPSNRKTLESSTTQRGGQRREPDREPGHPGSRARRGPLGVRNSPRESTKWNQPIRPEQKPGFERGENMPIRQPPQHVSNVHTSSRLFEGQLQLAAPALTADRAKSTIPKGVSQCISRFTIQRETQPRGKACGPPGARRVVVKTARMKNSQSSLSEIFEAALEIDDRHPLRGVRYVQRTDQCIDTEIPPV